MGIAVNARCTVCHSTGEPLGVSRRSGLTGQLYELCRCYGCGLVFTAPNPTDAELDAVYSGTYWSDKDIEGGLGMAGKCVAWFNMWRLAWVIRPLLARLWQHAALLEVGCGAGQLTKILCQRGFRVEVTEHAPDMLARVCTKLGIVGHHGNLPELDLGARFDAVIFNNVLEHVRNPRENLAAAKQCLRPGGLIFVELPNIDSLEFRLFRHRWYAMDVPAHLSHFSPLVLDALAAGTGLARVWGSTFSPRTSAANIAVSLIPSMDPRLLRRAGSVWRLGLYLVMQLFVLPFAWLESRAGKGGILRRIYAAL